MRRCFAVLAALLFLVVAPPGAQAGARAIADTTRLGIPFTRWTTVDRFHRTITFYLSNVPDSLRGRSLPLVLVVDGSGCQSVWSRVGERIGGGHQNLVLRESRRRVRVMIVEKPGVTFLDMPEQPGSALGASAEFLREHTLERWSEANAAALRAVLEMPGVDRTRVLVAGHSEGGTVAGHVAALEPRVTHAALLSCGGATQLFDLAQLFGAAQPGDAPGAAAARRQEVFDEWRRIRADSASTTKLWLGHPYRRWYTFASHDLLGDALATRAQLFLAHGTADRSSAIESFDWLVATLAARGREATVERVEGADHGFAPAADGSAGAGGAAGASAPPGGLTHVFARMLDWFLAGN